MSRLVKFILVVASIAILSGCNQSPLVEDTSLALFPSSLKGYELYSWQENGDWYFTLVTGTNRTKTSAEITSEEDILEDDGWLKITVMGVPELVKVLDRLPSSEQIFWLDGKRLAEVGETSKFVFPPGEVVDQVRQYSEGKGINLEVVH
jgi:hypothetical protein